MKKIQIGDLVRITRKKGTDSCDPVGIVTEVRDLVYEPSGDSYTAITALVGDEYYTFSEQDFILINKVKRIKRD